MEAAHLSWRPLGQLLVDEGLLTPEQLEEALDKQATTGRRLGELAVELGFVSHLALSRVLAAQYGVELKSETGFGTGLRAELERRVEGSTPGPDFIVALPPLELAPPLAPRPFERHSDLEEELEALRQTSEYGHEKAARLSEALKAKEDELATLQEAHDRRLTQAIKFAAAMRERDRRLTAVETELEALREAAAELAQTRGALEHTDREAELLAAQLHERETELGELRTQHERVRRQATKFATGMRSAERQAAELAQAVGERDGQLAGGHQTLAALRARYERRNAQAARFAAAMRAQSQANVHGNDELAERERELAELRATYERLRDQATRFAQRARKRNAVEEISRLTDQLAARDEAISELQAELTAQSEAGVRGNDELAQLADAVGARDLELAERERERAELQASHEQLHDQATRLAQRARKRNRVEEVRLTDLLGARDQAISELQAELAAQSEASARGNDELAQLTEALRVRDLHTAELHATNQHLHEQATRLAQRARRRTMATTPQFDHSRPAPVGYLVFAQLARRYALVERAGALPEPESRLELPDVGPGTLRVVRVGPSPLPNDPRSCVFAEQVLETA